MADYDEIDDNEGGNEPSLHDVRKLLKEVQKQNKDKDAEIAKLQKRITQQSVADTLKAKGVKPALARFILSDGVDPSEDGAVDKWLQENGELFGVAPAGEAGGSEPTSPIEQQLAAVQQAERGATPAPGSKVEQMFAELNVAKTEEQFAAWQEKYGNVKLQ